MDHFFTIAIEHLPNPKLIVARNRKILFANIAAISLFDIVIVKDLTLTFHHHNIINAVDRTLMSKTPERLEIQIPGPARGDAEPRARF